MGQDKSVDSLALENYDYYENWKRQKKWSISSGGGTTASSRQASPRGWHYWSLDDLQKAIFPLLFVLDPCASLCPGPSLLCSLDLLSGQQLGHRYQKKKKLLTIIILIQPNLWKYFHSSWFPAWPVYTSDNWLRLTSLSLSLSWIGWLPRSRLCAPEAERLGKTPWNCASSEARGGSLCGPL